MKSEKNNEYLEFAKSLALEAGEIMRKYFMVNTAEWKSDNTPITLADTEINALVIERVRQVYPDHTVLGEGESAVKDNTYAWVCDPVDGTMPYSHGLPISSFSLAFCDDGVPIVGVVYDPFLNRLFYAEKGGGAFCNGDPIKVNNNLLERSVVEVQGFGNRPELPMAIDRSNAIKDTLNRLGAKTTQLWSSILPSALVANGNYTAVLMNGMTIQDGAAIKVIVEEAGGKVTDIYGNEQRYDQPSEGFIASNGIVHDELVKIVKEATV